jgi:GT2 family glycosyltransferase
VADAPLVSILIPTHQRRGSLSCALKALATQSAPSDTYEVIVSIDGSTDGTREMLAELSVPFLVRSVGGRRRGRAAACNAAASAAVGEILIVLDDDMQAGHRLVDSHRRHHPRGSRRAVLGAVPVTLRPTSTRAAAFVQAKFAHHLAVLAQPAHSFTTRDFYSGNLSIRADVFREVGGFDETFAIYGNEDVELALRLRAAGVDFRFDPMALARQEYAKDLRALARDTVAKGRTAVTLARKHPDAFGSLRLAHPRDASRAWLALRALLLDLSGRWSGADDAVFTLAGLLESAGCWRSSLFYRAVLDYAFWAGVTEALDESPDRAPLHCLSKDIRRGPIDLLLHG